MGTMPINRLLITMSLPMIISMLVQAMYNIVDSIFVSRIDQAALTAVSMAFPIQNLLIAVSAGTCVGVNALLSRSLGEKNYKSANLAASNGLFLALVSFLFFALFGIFGSRLFFESQTSNPVIIEYGVKYLQIICIFSFGILGEMMFERILQSTGQTFYCMITQGTGAIFNIVMDPVLIFGLAGFPAMGIEGAAIATVSGQILAFILAALINHHKNHEVRITIRGFKPHRHTISVIYQVGVPSIIMQSISSVMTFGMNKILIAFSETAVAVFGVYFKLQSFIFMPIFGLNNGMIPIVAYNYGSRSRRDHASWTCHLPVKAGCYAGTFPGRRRDDRHWSTCTAHYQPQLHICRLLYYPGFCLPGPWKRCLLPDRVCSKAAYLYPASGCLLCIPFRPPRSMVLHPAGRNHLHDLKHHPVPQDLCRKDPASGYRGNSVLSPDSPAHFR